MKSSSSKEHGKPETISPNMTKSLSMAGFEVITYGRF
jgi:hypothetical protein